MKRSFGRFQYGTGSRKCYNRINVITIWNLQINRNNISFDKSRDFDVSVQLIWVITLALAFDVILHVYKHWNEYN